MSKSARPCLARFWALTAVVQIVVVMGARAEEPKDIFFHDGYKKALREAKLTQRPIFLEFRCAP
jgi:hypothetical protein